jgi:hypothetical protein
MKTVIAGLQLTSNLIKSSWYWNPLVWLYTALLLVYACRFPLSYDEAYTFNYFTNRSLWNVLATYPEPNNHVFHSLTTWFSWKLFHWIPGPISVRLPSIVASVLCFQLAQHHILKRSARYGQILLALVVITSNYFEFSFQARGYAMHTCFALISYCLIQLKQADFKTRYAGFMLLCFLGLFTNPAYLFTAVTLGIFWLLNEANAFKTVLRDVIILTLIFSLFTLLAYTPIILHEGIEALIDNKFIQPLAHFTISNCIQFTNKLGLFAFLPYPFAFIIPLLFILLIIKKKQYALLSFIVVPFIMMYLMNQLPEFKRIFLPLTMLITFITLQAFSQWDGQPSIKHQVLKIIQPTLMIILIASGLYHFEHIHKKHDFNTAFQLKKINQYVEQANKVFVHDLYWHLKIPVEAQHIYNRNHWGFDQGLPQQLNPNEYVLSSLSLPQFQRIDTFKLFNGVAYLYTKK